MWKPIAKKIKAAGLAAGLAMVIVVSGCATSEDSNWRRKLAQELPVLGHRNWILIADSAYPAQSRAGIETIATGASQIEVVTAVLKAVDKAEHVRAKVYLDAEMEYVSEQEVPGINGYREKLTSLLEGRAVKSVRHEALIAKLDEAAETFRVLILKTKLTLPYTSVFLELDCGYWDAESEQKLRQAIQQEK